MCGLYGIVVTNPEAIDINRLKMFFTAIAHGNNTRGRDSFGMWSSEGMLMRQVGAISKNGKVVQMFLDANITDPKPGFWLAGHTRAATHGAVKEENCHPFESGNITLAHNGVVTVDGFDNKDHEVDSGRIAQAIVAHGWKDGIAKVSGSCALLVSVKPEPEERDQSRSLYIYRHNQTLNVARAEWGYAISSTKTNLEEAFQFAGLEAIEYGEPEADYLVEPWGKVKEHCPAKAYVYQQNTSCGFQGGTRLPYEDYDYEEGEGRWKATSWAKGKVWDNVQSKYVWPAEMQKLQAERAKNKANTKKVKADNVKAFNKLGDICKREPNTQLADVKALSCGFLLRYRGAQERLVKKAAIVDQCALEPLPGLQEDQDLYYQRCDICFKRHPIQQMYLEEIHNEMMLVCNDDKCAKSMLELRRKTAAWLEGKTNMKPFELARLRHSGAVYTGIVSTLNFYNAMRFGFEDASRKFLVTMQDARELVVDSLFPNIKDPDSVASTIILVKGDSH